MMRAPRLKWLHLLVVSMVVGASIWLACALGPLVDGVSLDILMIARGALFASTPRADEAASSNPVTIIAIDEETYRREPFVGTPRALWLPLLAPVLDAVNAAGAKVVGVDLIDPTSVESALPGYERPYLLALRRLAKRGALVLAKVQHSDKPLTPHRGQVIAAGGMANVRAANLIEDPDGVLRRAPLFFDKDDGGRGDVGEETSFPMEVAARAMGVTPERRPDGATWFAGRRVTSVDGRSILLNHHRAGAAPVPIHSIADLRACALKGDVDFFRREFADRVVLFGAVLDVEDRRLSSNRWVTRPEANAAAPRCAGLARPERPASTLISDSVPGVTLHAAAVLNILDGHALGEVRGLTRVAALSALAALAAGLTLWLAPGLAGAAILGVAVVWTLVCALALNGGASWPWAEGLIAMAPIFPMLMTYRSAILDRDQRRTRDAFRLYLPPDLIEEMIEMGRSPTLGGEERSITILFSDIVGYTRISEGMSPEALVAMLNRYFTVMTDIVERHGGFVDKFIGDAVLAVFGAPYCPTNHATAAVAAAVEMRAALARPDSPLRDANGTPGALRIGVATGRALIGNIGSPRRFNYTVMGDAVNLASRLEGVNKFYGGDILVSEATVAEHGDPTAYREVDRVGVLGRLEPVTIYQPVDATPWPTDTRDEPLAAYQAGLRAWREGDFASAALIFTELGLVDPVSNAMAKSALRLAQSPPTIWDGVTRLDSK